MPDRDPIVDSFGRGITYLRISVTDRCNLRCTYCMPEEGLEMVRHQDILSFEEITEIAQSAVKVGLTKIRITGGEPLVRRNIVTLVGMLAAVPGVDDLSMSTNGTFLSGFATALSDAGLHRINISLDTIDPDRYREITRGGDVVRVIEGIESAQKAGLNPIKINCVVTESTLQSDIDGMSRFCKERDLELRFIGKMDFATGTFSVVEGGSGGDCEKCNRLRLSSDGYIRPCLFSGLAFSVRDLGADRAIAEAIKLKPASGLPCSGNHMNRIGG